MLKALFDFFTIHVTLPCVAALALTIYQKVYTADSHFVTIYALFMIFWATLMTELWKRKQSHIAYTWGYNPTDLHCNDPNPEFRGYTSWNWTTKSPRLMSEGALVGNLFKVFGQILAFTLIGLNIYVYYKMQASSKEEGTFLNENKTLKSILTTIISSLFNVIYGKFVPFIVAGENHAFNEPKEASFMLKTIAFRFVNYNLVIFIALYETLGIVDENNSVEGGHKPTKENYQKMYNMIFTIVATKVIMTLLTKHLKIIALHALSNCMHFRSVNALAVKQ